MSSKSELIQQLRAAVPVATLSECVDALKEARNDLNDAVGLLAEVQEALDNIDKDFPVLAGRPVEIAGFIWFQGWNDMGEEDARKQYEDNLVHLITDVRAKYNKPRLPVVIGELGNGGPQAGKNMLAIRAAQKAAVARRELGGIVSFVSTTAFARPKENSPNVTHGHHWFGNAESYFLIGDALG